MAAEFLLCRLDFAKLTFQLAFLLSQPLQYVYVATYYCLVYSASYLVLASTVKKYLDSSLGNSFKWAMLPSLNDTRQIFSGLRQDGKTNRLQ